MSEAHTSTNDSPELLAYFDHTQTCAVCIAGDRGATVCCPDADHLSAEMFIAKGRNAERARIEQGGDLHALITNGHHMERLLTSLHLSLLNQDRIVMLLDDSDGPQPGSLEVAEFQLDLGELCGAIPNALYEWDKRARRSKVDWWNRALEGTATDV